MSRVHVAVAVIRNASDEVLIALRQSHQHQGGLWEFPGGKVDDNEYVFDALIREIKEEVGLDILQAEALIDIEYDYGDKVVLLDIWQVTEFEGHAQGLEGQTLQWCAIEELTNWTFPQANNAIIELLQSGIEKKERVVLK